MGWLPSVGRCFELMCVPFTSFCNFSKELLVTVTKFLKSTRYNGYPALRYEVIAYASVYGSYHGLLAPEGTCVHCIVKGVVPPWSVDYTDWSPDLVWTYCTEFKRMCVESVGVRY